MHTAHLSWLVLGPFSLFLSMMGLRSLYRRALLEGMVALPCLGEQQDSKALLTARSLPSMSFSSCSLVISQIFHLFLCASEGMNELMCTVGKNAY